MPVAGGPGRRAGGGVRRPDPAAWLGLSGAPGLQGRGGGGHAPGGLWPVREAAADRGAVSGPLLRLWGAAAVGLPGPGDPGDGRGAIGALPGDAGHPHCSGAVLRGPLPGAGAAVHPHPDKGGAPGTHPHPSRALGEAAGPSGHGQHPPGPPHRPARGGGGGGEAPPPSAGTAPAGPAEPGPPGGAPPGLGGNGGGPAAPAAALSGGGGGVRPAPGPAGGPGQLRRRGSPGLPHRPLSHPAVGRRGVQRPHRRRGGANTQ